MRISVKGRYALAATLLIADRQTQGAKVSAGAVSDELGMSKIYLEQVFAQLKKSGVLASAKGPKGGYQFAHDISSVTVWELLSPLETGFLEEPEDTVSESDPGIEMALRSRVYEPLDAGLREVLSSITVQELLEETRRQRGDQSFMLGL